MLDPKKFIIFHGIGRRLLLWFSLFFLIPLVTVSYTGYQQSKKAIHRQVYDHFESLLNLQQEALINYLHQKELQLKSSVAENEFLYISTVVLQSTTFGKGDILAARERVQKYVTEKNQEMNSKSLCILGKEGCVIASSDPDMLGKERKELHGYFQEQRNLSDRRVHYIEASDVPEIVVYAPIQSEIGEHLGLFTMCIDMEDIYKILETHTGLGETGETFLVNAGGTMISRSRFLPDAILKQEIPLEEIRESKDWRMTEDYPLNYRGVPVIQAHIPFPYFGWTLVAQMETSESFRDLTTQRNRTILMVLVLFLLLVMTAALISKNLTQPIRSLAAAAKRVGQGDLDQQIDVTSGDELGDLSFEFNRMTENLRESKKKMDQWHQSIQQEVEIRTRDLIKSELKFKNLMEKANDAIMIFSTENKLCTLANLKAEILTGYSQEELFSSRLFDFFLSDDLPRIAEHYREAMAKGSSTLYNLQLQRKDGRIVFVDISNSLMEFQDQTFLNCILHDVTEQRMMQREREAVFEISDIVSKSSDLNTILQKSMETILHHLELNVAVIYLYNDESNELLLACQQGFTETFLQNFGLQAVTAESHRISVKTAYTKDMQYLQNPFEGYRDTFLRSDVNKEDLQTLVSLPLIAEGTLVGILEVITSRKRRFAAQSLILVEALTNQLAAGILRIQVEEEKHKDDQFLASILTESADAIVSLDGEDKITSWNRGGEKIFRLKKEKVIGKPFSNLFKNPTLFNKDQTRRKLREKGFIKDYDLKNVTWDGREVTLHISQTAIIDHYGKVAGSFAIMRDVTEEREMQQRIQQSEKLSSVGQLAAGIAHEIGTPLNIISGNAEYIMMDLNKSDPRMEELSIIIQQTERITKLIQQLMDYARDIQPSFEKTNIHELIDNTLALTRHPLNKLSIQLETKQDASLPIIVADPHQLQQVFLNIIMNAIQAMPGGGTLTIETAVNPDKEKIRVSIRDTGSGIRRENIKNIFDPFFTTKEVGQGTGLGLAVSHRIIENHKGRIEVKSKVQQGTCFTITLPIHAKES